MTRQSGAGGSSRPCPCGSPCTRKGRKSEHGGQRSRSPTEVSARAQGCPGCTGTVRQARDVPALPGIWESSTHPSEPRPEPDLSPGRKLMQATQCRENLDSQRVEKRCRKVLSQQDEKYCANIYKEGKNKGSFGFSG